MYRAVPLEEVIASFSPKRQREIAEKTEILLQQIATLRELRKAQEITQTQLAADLGVTQETVSRMEKRSDMLLSTLAKAIKALGGELVITARFPKLGTLRLDVGDGIFTGDGFNSTVVEGPKSRRRGKE